MGQLRGMARAEMAGPPAELHELRRRQPPGPPRAGPVDQAVEALGVVALLLDGAPTGAEALRDLRRGPASLGEDDGADPK